MSSSGLVSLVILFRTISRFQSPLERCVACIFRFLRFNKRSWYGCCGGKSMVVDLRRSSATYGKHVGVELSADGGEQSFVPRGFAHGFCTLDDRFHKTGGRGTGGLFADSSFAVCGTRIGKMARWRQAIELAMTDEEIGSLTTISRSRTAPRVGLRGRKCCSPTVKIRRSLRWSRALVSIIRR